MGLYKRILEEASQEETPGHKVMTPSYGRAWSLSAPGAGGYVTVENLEWEQERLQQERQRVQQERDKRSADIWALQTLSRQGVHSWVQGTAFRSLQRRYPGEWDRIRWERRTRG